MEKQAKHAAMPLLPAFEEAPYDNVAQHAPKVTIQDHMRDDKPSRDHQPQVHSYLVGGQVGHDNAHLSHIPDRKPQMWNSRGDIEANQADPASSQSMSDFVTLFARQELENLCLQGFCSLTIGLKVTELGRHRS